MQIEVPLPPLGDRLAILRHAASSMPVDPDADWHALAAPTERLSDAKLRALVHDAVVVALRRDTGASTVRQADLEAALHRWLDENAALGC